MTITEFASLELIAPHTLEDPAPLFVKLMGRLADQQASWSNHELRFFTNPAAPSEIHIITGWKDIPAHEAWIASDQNKELLFKFGRWRFLEVKRMVHLDIDFNLVPTNRKVFVCERYGPGLEDETEKEAESEEKEAEVLKGSKKDVEWIGAGKNLDPKAEGAFYKLSVCSERWRAKIAASASQKKEVIILKELDVKALGKKP